MSSKRKALLISSFVLAVWCTVGTVGSLVFAALMQGQVNEDAIGTVIGLLVIIPSLIGTALSISTFDRRLVNPPAVWIAAIWNIAVLASWLLLTVVGILMGG